MTNGNDLIKEELDNMRKYRYVENDYEFNEEELRIELLKAECNDIVNNSVEFINDIYDLQAQCECIRMAKSGTIDYVVRTLNNNYGYEIRVINTNNVALFNEAMNSNDLKVVKEKLDMIYENRKLDIKGGE